MSLKETVVIDLRNAIVKREYKPGERLTEAALCSRYGISRTPIRQALEELHKEGLLDITPNLGARVVELSKDDVLNIYDVLTCVWGAANHLACSRITAEEIRKLEEYQFIIEKASAQKNYDLVFESNYEFHKLIAESTRNPYLIQIWLNLWHLASPFGRFTLSPMVPGQLKATLEEHPKIIDAFKKGNPAMAEFVAKNHLETARKFLFQYLENIQNNSAKSPE